jgi:hypothetical protein
MRSGHAFLAALSLSLTQYASAGFYLKEKWVGNDFFRDWNWETKNDPTHGRVNYVSQAEAIAKNLSYGTSSSCFSLIPLDIRIHLTGTFSVENNAFIMRADDWSIVDPSARGRDSVRISTQNAYGESIFVLDLAHMPAGCATWPAFWTKSQKGPWPHGGEVDIIEGTLLVSFASLPSYPYTRSLRVLLPCRYQFARDKSSHSAYHSRMPNASRSTAPAAVWVGPYLCLTSYSESIF